MKTQTKHTAGPWRVVPYPKDQNRGYYIEAQSFGIAEVHDPSGFLNDEANAALIAAAPEMLEACKYVIQWHREHDSGEGELFGLDFVTTCINAVRKADNNYTLNQ